MYNILTVGHAFNSGLCSKQSRPFLPCNIIYGCFLVFEVSNIHFTVWYIIAYVNEHDSPTRRLQFIVSPHTHGTTAAAEVSTPLGRVLNRDQINSRVTKVKKSFLLRTCLQSRNPFLFALLDSSRTLGAAKRVKSKGGVRLMMGGGFSLNRVNVIKT